jgi:hypothetical protein
MESKKRLLEIIKNSGLEPTFISIWEIFLEISSPEQDRAVLDVLEKDITHLRFLTDNICEKFWAMKTWDKKMIEKIVVKEKEYLSHMTLAAA